MRRITIVLGLALALVLALAGGAAAVPPGAGHTVVSTLGRNTVTHNHFGDPNRGQVLCSAQGEVVDTNGNGIGDALRGRAACLETRTGARYAKLLFVRLQVFFAESWVNVAVDNEDKISTAPTAYVINYTPTTSFCADDIDLTYRVAAAWEVGWNDTSLTTTRTVVSHQFVTRAVVNTQVC
jgi:hypothetical protein